MDNMDFRFKQVETKIDKLEKDFDIVHDIQRGITRIETRLEEFKPLRDRVDMLSHEWSQAKGASIAIKILYGILCGGSGAAILKAISKIPF